MNLLIAGSLPADLTLDRAISWRDEIRDVLAPLGADDRPDDRAPWPAADEPYAWYELRLSSLRAVIGEAP